MSNTGSYIKSLPVWRGPGHGRKAAYAAAGERSAYNGRPAGFGAESTAAGCPPGLRNGEMAVEAKGEPCSPCIARLDSTAPEKMAACAGRVGKAQEQKDKRHSGADSCIQLRYPMSREGEGE